MKSPVETDIVCDHPLLCSLSPSYAITKTETEIKIGLPVLDPLTYTFRFMTCTPANPDSLWLEPTIWCRHGGIFVLFMVSIHVISMAWRVHGTKFKLRTNCNFHWTVSEFWKPRTHRKGREHIKFWNRPYTVPVLRSGPGPRDKIITVYCYK